MASSLRRSDGLPVLAMQGGFDVIGSSFTIVRPKLSVSRAHAFKLIVYETALENGTPTGLDIIMDAPFCTSQGSGLPQKCFVNFDKSFMPAPRTMRWGGRAIHATLDDGPPRLRLSRECRRLPPTAKKLGVGDFPQLPVDFAAGRAKPPWQCLVRRLCYPRQSGTCREAIA